MIGTSIYLNQLIEFQKTHKKQEIRVSQSIWEYLIGGGKDKEVVLLTHGGGGTAESLFRYMMALEDDYRVVAPTIPSSVSTVGEAISGILAILSKEGVETAHICGVSMGGMIGQCFFRQQPDRVLTLTLFHSMLPSLEYAEKFQKRSKLLSILPHWFIVMSGRRWVKKQINDEAVNAAPGEKAFWLSYFYKFYRSDIVTKQYFVSRSKILVDYYRNYSFNSDDLAMWSGGIFIIESENDQVVTGRERERLKQMYPKAKVHTFRGAGHLGGGLFKVEVTASLVKDFLTSPANCQNQVPS